MAKDAERLAAQAQRLRDLKAMNRSLTFHDVAEAVDVTERQVQRWFAGDSDISGEHLEKLAAFLDTTPDFIEYGVMRRFAPDLFPVPDRSHNDERFEGIEQRLEWIESQLTALALVLEAERESKREPAKPPRIVSSSRTKKRPRTRPQ